MWPAERRGVLTDLEVEQAEEDWMAAVIGWDDEVPTGVLIGLTEAMAGLLFTPSAKSMFSFGILVLVLLLRPQGIMGKRAA